MLTTENFLRDFPHGVVISIADDIVHAVGYPNSPSEADIANLREELAEDESIGLTEVTDYDMRIVSGEVWQAVMIANANGDW
jgi:hypothetical protein